MKVTSEFAVKRLQYAIEKQKALQSVVKTVLSILAKYEGKQITARLEKPIAAFLGAGAVVSIGASYGAIECSIWGVPYLEGYSNRVTFNLKSGLYASNDKTLVMSEVQSAVKGILDCDVAALEAAQANLPALVAEYEAAEKRLEQARAAFGTAWYLIQ